MSAFADGVFEIERASLANPSKFIEETSKAARRFRHDEKESAATSRGDRRSVAHKSRVNFLKSTCGRGCTGERAINLAARSPSRGKNAVRNVRTRAGDFNLFAKRHTPATSKGQAFSDTMYARRPLGNSMNS